MTLTQNAVLTAVANSPTGFYFPSDEQIPTIFELFDMHLLIICPPGHRWRLSDKGKALFSRPVLDAAE